MSIEIQYPVQGVALYDPRIAKYVPGADNPALILADVLVRLDTQHPFLTTSAEFWKQIAKLADYCDENITLPCKYPDIIAKDGLFLINK